MAVVDGSDRIDSICYCSDTSNDPVIGHPGRVLENVTMLTTAARQSQKQKPFYLLSTRAGVMNRKQVDAMRQEGLVVIGGTRQGLARTRPHGALGQRLAATAAAQREAERARGGRIQTRTAHDQRIRRQADARRLRPHGHARAARHDAVGGRPGRTTDRISGRAEGGFGRDSRTRPNSASSPSISRTRTTCSAPLRT